jgi:ribonuclease HII
MKCSIVHEERGKIERELLESGITNIVGVDEVGRGCIAGPVFAAAAVLDYNKLFALPPEQLALIRDSKTLSAKQRSSLIPIIKEVALDIKISGSSVETIEQHGIVRALSYAMHKALKNLTCDYDFLLIDGKQKLQNFNKEQRAVVKGDNFCYCIAAASIIAKEARDNYMREQSLTYPVYGFEKHVGYGTGLHIQMLKEHGICPLHRRNFAPINRM